MKSPQPAGTAPAPNIRLGVACGLLSGVCLSTGGLVLAVRYRGNILTALPSRLLLAERHDGWTWLAMAAAVLGIAIMFGDGIDGGGYLGVAIAVVAVPSYGFMLVIMRFSKARDMLPATALSGFVTLAVAYLMAVDLDISAWDLGIGVFLGVFQFGLGFVFIAVAIRHLPAAHVALLSLSEVVLAPTWVWLGVGETPTTLGFAGRAIVLTAVAAQAARSVHRARAARP